MTFDNFGFWFCLTLATVFLSANLWLAFKSFDAMPQALGTYAVIVVIGAVIAIFKPETRHPILALCTALLTAIPMVN